MSDQGIGEILRRLAALEEWARQPRAESAIEGTFTPTFFGTGTAGTFTYAAGRRDGRYTLDGARLDFAIEIAISGITVAPTGDMRITDLPFAAAGNQDGSVAFGLIANVNLSVGALMLTGFIPSGGTYIDLREVFDNAGSTAYPAANFTNANAQLRLTGTYWISA